MRGRKPKPTLSVIEGNPGKRRINPREPKPRGPKPWETHGGPGSKFDGLLGRKPTADDYLGPRRW